MKSYPDRRVEVEDSRVGLDSRNGRASIQWQVLR